MEGQQVGAGHEPVAKALRNVVYILYYIILLLPYMLLLVSGLLMSSSAADTYLCVEFDFLSEVA